MAANLQAPGRIPIPVAAPSPFTGGVWNHIEINIEASGASTDLTLGNRQDPGYSDWTMVDVEDQGPAGNRVPDQGAGLAVTAATLLGLCALSLRRRLA